MKESVDVVELSKCKWSNLTWASPFGRVVGGSLSHKSQNGEFPAAFPFVFTAYFV